MRGRDEETGEYRDISRSENRRNALEVLALGEQLVGLTPAQLAKLPIPEDLMPHIEYTKRITSHGARKRQLAFLAKHMRRETDATLQAIRDVLDVSSEVSRREVAQMHRVEQWRDRLIAQGDQALGEFVAAFPDADRQQLRTLVRNAVAEKAKNKPPRAFRELFQVLRGLVLAGSGAALAADGDSDADDLIQDDADDAAFDLEQDIDEDDDTLED
jgi:ribosome-associated protein